MSANETGREVAELLFKAGAIHVSRQQPFILAAGWASPVYVDVRLLLGDPDLRQAVSDLAARYAAATFPPGSFDAIAGAETAGGRPTRRRQHTPTALPAARQQDLRAAP